MAARKPGLIVVALVVAIGGLKASGCLGREIYRPVAGNLPPSHEASADHRAGSHANRQPALLVTSRSDVTGGGGQVSGTLKAGEQAAADARVARRIISLVPALTEMLFAIGAGSQMVAVSSYDDFPPETRSLPRVGALLDPDVERILALRPDLVLTYGSQSSLETQLARAGIRTFSYRHGGIATLLQTLRDLGMATGRTENARRAAEGIQAQLDVVRAKVRGRTRLRTMLVFGRQPRSLQQLYASGGAGFLHEILETAGAINVFADIARESVQPSHETLITRAPDVILEVSPTRQVAGVDASRERAVWAPLASIPAVRNGRIHFLYGDYLVVPGPRVVLAAEAFARVLHPEAFK